ncbi:unnamed protein product [Ambrosiozyma monospora]|uniref:Unnamed protein product n=1 Tax=Ambrosiozyma monospora TaxID=43982 RepID=A0ACB5TDZ9_AMBMO|nr:unnamed protein product [Ambrosiozyma monospora]
MFSPTITFVSHSSESVKTINDSSVTSFEGRSASHESNVELKFHPSHHHLNAHPPYNHQESFKMDPRLPVLTIQSKKPILITICDVCSSKNCLHSTQQIIKS